MTLQEQLRKLTTGGHGVTHIASETLFEDCAQALDRIEQVLILAEAPTLIGPALAELGDNDHEAWNRGWSAATRFFRAHLCPAFIKARAECDHEFFVFDTDPPGYGRCRKCGAEYVPDSQSAKAGNEPQ